MQRILFATLFLYLCYSGHGQGPPDYPLKNSAQIALDISTENLQGSRLAYQYTYIGQNLKAISTYDFPLEWGLDTLTNDLERFFRKYKPIDAAPYIVEQAPKDGFVIIGEAHHRAEHRVFTKSLLEDLYAKGYRYLGIEAVTPHIFDTTQYLFDTLLHERGYPLHNPISGSYVREPQMSNMIREALALGYQVFGYDYFSKEPERDLHQAWRVKKFVDEHPPAGTLIHCGWYHAIESNFPKRIKDNYMALHLKGMTGKNPLTIYLDALNEKIAQQKSPYYDMIDYPRSAVLVDHDGRAFGGFDGDQHVDILLYSPPIVYKYGRPSWLWQSDSSLQFIEVNQKSFEELLYPVLVAAYIKGEEDGTPIDIIELEETTADTRLLLGPGDYIINIIGAKGLKRTYSYIVER